MNQFVHVQNVTATDPTGERLASLYARSEQILAWHKRNDAEREAMLEALRKKERREAVEAFAAARRARKAREWRGDVLIGALFGGLLVLCIDMAVRMFLR